MCGISHLHTHGNKGARAHNSVAGSCCALANFSRAPKLSAHCSFWTDDVLAKCGQSMNMQRVTQHVQAAYVSVSAQHGVFVHVGNWWRCN